MPQAVVVRRPAAAPYQYGSPQQPVNVRGQVQIPGLVRTQEQPAAWRKSYRATSADQVQFSVAPLYDYVDWGTAAGLGANKYTFFGRSQQGTVTNVDTNMPQANNVGAGNKFVVEHMWIVFKSGLAPMTNGAEAALATANQANDFWAVMKTGWFQFYINGLPQCGFGISPLLLAACPISLNVGGGVGAGVTALQVTAPFANNSGYNTARFPFELDDTQNFSAEVQFPTAVTLPSGNTTSKFGVCLWGRAFRQAG